jgi:hypothetical protein
MARKTTCLERDRPMPTVEELEVAHVEFERLEPRALFYKAATELVDSAWKGHSSLSLAEATAVLLKTWNESFYRFRPFTEEHYLKLEALLESYHESLARYRQRDIEGLMDEDESPAKELFAAFENVLFPVGAAKCLHLLAPRFFPLWDRAIAAGYGLALDKKGDNAGRYWTFMQFARRQIQRLGESYSGNNPLKSLDEYNYCAYTKGLKLASSSR